MAQSEIISESEFYMWRAVFAFALSDGVVTDEERALLNEYKANTAFSPRQLAILRDDFAYPQDVEDMYNAIQRPEDQHRFCVMVRALAWCEGDLDKQDEALLKRVSCLNAATNRDIVRRSREDPALHDFHDQYIKSGMMGFMQTPHLFETRV